jgi:hypothetical protein
MSFPALGLLNKMLVVKSAVLSQVKLFFPAWLLIHVQFNGYSFTELRLAAKCDTLAFK